MRRDADVLARCKRAKARPSYAKMLVAVADALALSGSRRRLQTIGSPFVTDSELDSRLHAILHPRRWCPVSSFISSVISLAILAAALTASLWGVSFCRYFVMDLFHGL